MKKRNQNLIQWVGLRLSKEFSIQTFKPAQNVGGKSKSSLAF